MPTVLLQLNCYVELAISYLAVAITIAITKG